MPGRPRSSLLLVLVSALVLAPLPVGAADLDLDGVDDAVDNCVGISNPDQANANAHADDDSSLAGVQRYGDVCDADLDDDGITGASDFFAVLLPCFGQAAAGSCLIADLDGDGAIGPSDFFAGLRPAFGSAPGPGFTQSVVPVMLPDRPEGFFTFPWPNDIRVAADGSVDLIGLPAPGNAGVFLDFLLGTPASLTQGFGLSSAAYLQTDGPIDASTLPSPSQSLEDGAAVMLVDLDDAAAARTPILLDFKDASQATGYRPGNLLAALPYPGYPLQEETRYALLVFSGVQDAGGVPIAAAPLIAELDQPFGAATPVSEDDWNALRQQRDDVLAYVAANTTHAAADLRAFSVFTTQDATFELDAIAAAIEAASPPPIQIRSQLIACTSETGRGTIRGSIGLPKWQQGSFPYTLSGGAVVIGGGGLAVQQSTEFVRLDVTYPCGTPPAEGWPILLFMDGTGGSARSRNIPYLGNAALDFVVGSIAPLYSGDRSTGADPATLFFNLANPLAARTNQIQQASEMIVLRRVIEDLVLSASEVFGPDPVETDDARILIAGHSQGALTVPHVIGADPSFGAAFISAGGGGLYHTILNRGDTRPLVENLLGFEASELDLFHPTIQALQSVIEVGDATNYARRPQNAHILSIGGLKDGCAPWEVVTQLGIALDLDLHNGVFAPTFGDASLEPIAVDQVISANLPDGRTGVTVQLDGGHFGSITNPQLGVTFVESFGLTGLPVVGPSTLDPDDGGGQCPRFAPIQ